MNHNFPALETLLTGETLEVEYKRDLDVKNKSVPFPDDGLAESIMAISNAHGGYLLLGVEDKTGRVLGVHPDRRGRLSILRGKIARKFMREPDLALHEYHDARGRVIAVYVSGANPPPHQLMSGVLKVRKDLGKKQGPENVPFPLAEIAQWEAQRGVHNDFSSRLHSDLLVRDHSRLLDPIAIGIFQRRLREGRINNTSLTTIRGFEQQLEALGLTGTVGGRKVLSNAALVLFGSNEILQERIPSHRAQFQAFAHDGSLRYNLFSDQPGFDHRCLLYLATRLDELFRGVIERKEIMDGSFRIDIPDYGDDAVREATMNAFIHRDFISPEEVVIQINQRQFLVTNPGGFYRDVTPQNILFHEPCPRNKCLAQACADIGLVEKSGRGVDRIYLDQIRFMRPLPSYAASTTEAVRLSLLGGEGSREVIRWMFEFLGKQEDLVVRVMHGGLMHVLLTEGQATREELISSLPGLLPIDGRRAITELIDAGLIRPIGHGRGQRVVLSAQLQEALGKPEAFIYQAGVDVEQRQKIMQQVEGRGHITRGEAAELLSLPADVKMYRMLKRMVEDGLLDTSGKGSATKYVKP